MTARRCARALAGALLAASLLPAGLSPAKAETCLRGVNLSGAEFGTVPGRPDKDYTYPAASQIRRLAGLKMTAFRLPFRWERIQPTLGGALDETELARLDQSVAAAEAAGLSAILDLHNFGYYAKLQLGTPALPATALAEVWSRLATHWRDRPTVVFALMNEPHDIHSAVWAEIQNTAIAAIRKTGARQLILATGTAYGGAHSWTADLPVGNNGRDMQAVKDPLNRFAFDFHQYLDADFSGRSADCPAADRALKAIDDVGDWLAANRMRGFLGEFAASERPQCVRAMKTMAAKVDARPAQWLGWTAWGAGAWWPADYIFNLEPTSQSERPQMSALVDLLKGRASGDTCGAPAPS